MNEQAAEGNGPEHKVSLIVKCVSQHTYSDDLDRNTAVAFMAPWDGGTGNPVDDVIVHIQLYGQPQRRWVNGRVYGFDVLLDGLETA